MSTAKRVLQCSGTAPASAPVQEVLPLDLLLEIVALADVTTVVRCAATSRILRRAILDPAFRRRLALAAGVGFGPALLLGVSYWEHVNRGIATTTTHRVIHTPGPTKLRVRLDADSIRSDSFEPVASRGGLLVVRRYEKVYPERPYFKIKLRACDTSTGHVTPLPPTTLHTAYYLVVLSVGDARRSFELLVADMTVRFHRTFSSKDGQWSAIREVAVPHMGHQCHSYCSAVIGRTVYLPRQVQDISPWDHILALDVDAGEATMTALPPSCFSRMTATKIDEYLLLAPVRGRLCLLVAESRVIAMWTLTSAAEGTWSRQVVISSMEIARQAGLDPYEFTVVPFVPVGLGERSGAVILNFANDCRFPFLRLDLGTKKEVAPVITKLSSQEIAGQFTRFFLHEIDLVSSLQAMKFF